MSEVLKIQKWGNSQGIRLPKKLLELLNLKVNDKILIEEVEDGLKIKKVEKNQRKRKTIKELFANYDGNYKPKEMDWGEPQGKEIW